MPPAVNSGCGASRTAARGVGWRPKVKATPPMALAGSLGAAGVPWASASMSRRGVFSGSSGGRPDAMMVGHLKKLKPQRLCREEKAAANQLSAQ
jgi:hypothetical protein